MLDFRLIYQGLLLGADKEGHRSEHKQQIRRYFHEQLVHIWKTKNPLRYRIEGTPTSSDAELMASVPTNFMVGQKKLLPIATRDDLPPDN